MTAWRYMLDTNIEAEIIRHPNGRVARRIIEAEQACCISALVASELRYGARKRGSAKLSELVEALLGKLPIAAYDNASTADYADIRTDLTIKGNLIGPVDLFIAAHTRSLGLTLVTNNFGEFSCVEGLTVENWLEEQAP